MDAFEREFAAQVKVEQAAATSSGTAALHLGLHLSGVERDDEVYVSSFTFAASVNPILYLGATPRFIDSERESWNMDPGLLRESLEQAARRNRLPRAVVVVHIYGQSADMDPILAACSDFGVRVVEDAAEALGATYKDRIPGAMGEVGIYSFNGNKIITTSGGGMLVARDPRLVVHARELAAQAKAPGAHYEHNEVGYNYRLSNLLAAVGRAQLPTLEARVSARRANFARYKAELGELAGIEFMPEARWGRHTRWLTCITVDPARAGTTREELHLALQRANVESRPFWKPMHLQPVFQSHPTVGGLVAEELFEMGLCLPSGSNLTPAEHERVVAVIRETVRG